jgi:hypothetical protein
LRHRPGRKKQGGGLAHEPGNLLFEFGDDPAVAIAVGLDFCRDHGQELSGFLKAVSVDETGAALSRFVDLLVG